MILKEKSGWFPLFLAIAISIYIGIKKSTLKLISHQTKLLLKTPLKGKTRNASLLGRKTLHSSQNTQSVLKSKDQKEESKNVILLSSEVNFWLEYNPIVLKILQKYFLIEDLKKWGSFFFNRMIISTLRKNPVWKFLVQNAIPKPIFWELNYYVKAGKAIEEMH